MKKYRVIITPIAEANVVEAFAFIHQRAPLNSERWIRALYKAIHELEEFAGHSRAPESDYLGFELRHKLFKSHRIVYSINEQEQLIHVHYVRHGAQRAVGEPPGEDD
jgi:plasmid stabilization system protein ParE